MSKMNAKKLGVMMKKAREKAGLDHCSVAKEICVSKSYLIAIEEGNFETLPAFPFAIGFIKSFANEIGLDAVEIAVQFKAIVQPDVETEIIPDDVAQDKNVKKLFSQDDQPKKKGALYGGVAVMMSALSAVYMVFIGGGPQVAMIAEVPDFEAVQLADAKTPAQQSTVVRDSVGPVNAPSNIVPAVEEFSPASNQFLGVANADEDSDLAVNLQSAEVMLEARQDAWMRVTSQGAVLFEGILRAGDHFIPPMGPELNLTTSNAGGLALRIGEHDLGVLGGKGAIIENAKIDPDSLILRLVETL